MSTGYIYTEKNDCRDCYKCIRECPIKAIKMENRSASIIPERCVYCGHCTWVCPVEAKKVKEDISTVKYLLRNHKKVVVSLAPSYISEFSEYSPEEFAGILKMLGFYAVSETAIGAEIISKNFNKHFDTLPNGAYVSQCCPSVVELIMKYFPQHVDKILSQDTPMLAHGKYLKQYYGDDVKVVFIGPCIAKKREAEMTPGIIDAVVTFKKIKKWIDKELSLKISNNGIVKSDFEPFKAAHGNIYPLEGGMIANIHKHNPYNEIPFLTFSGMKNIIPIVQDLDSLNNGSKVFLELLACENGCINGPGTEQSISSAVRKLNIINNFKSNNEENNYKEVESLDFTNKYNYKAAVKVKHFEESEVIDTLQSIGKYTHADELNCGGCGYEKCIDFAHAILANKAEQKMCVSYMQRVAQDKANALLQRMPYGVAIVNRDLKIVECNRNFAELSGEDAVFAYEAKPGLEGAELRKLISYPQYFENLIDSGEDSLEKDIKTQEQFIHLSIFTLQGKQLYCAIVHNLRAPELKKDEMGKRVRRVIRENLETVQKIAFYLGENASNMETLLNSIVNIQDDDE